MSIQAMEWFRSYLTDRNQRVRIGCKVSDPPQVAYSVPQGSILGRGLPYETDGDARRLA